MIKTIKRAYNLLRAKTRDIGVKHKRSSKWRSVQQDFLEKNPVCAICGTKEKLNVHHKKPFHLFPELELEESNLITLCMSKQECHLTIAHGDDFKAYNSKIETHAEILNKDLTKFNSVAAEAKLNRKYE